MDESSDNPFWSEKMDGSVPPPLPWPSRPATPVAFFVLIPCFALMNFIIPLIVDKTHSPQMEMTIVFLWIGTVLAQVCFLAIWAALGPFHLWVRWPAVLLSGLVLYSSFLLFVLTHEHLSSDDHFEMAASTLFIPLLFLCAQFPLWIRKAISGWRIVPLREASEYSATEARQFGLSHILGLMVFFGVTLSLVQVGIAIWTSYGRSRDSTPMEFWLGLGAFGGIFCLAVAIGAGPCLRACFLARGKVLGCLAMIAVWIVVSLLLIAVMATIVRFGRGGLSQLGEYVTPIFLLCAATATVLMASLHLLRFTGYTMIRRTRADREPGPDLAMSGHLGEGDCPFAEQL